MDIFVNIMNPLKFKSTNFIWNQLRLNSPWSVGYVSTLIESVNLNSKEEWKKHYYESGEERLRLIEQECTPEEKMALLNFSKATTKLSQRCKELNANYGRTEKELNDRAYYMYEKIVAEGNPHNITFADCCYMVKYRVLGETWNGIMAREHNTIKVMEGMLPEVTFVKTSGERDYSYGIDYELFTQSNELICAIQIKPISYQKGFSKEIIKAKKANELKNQKYKDATNSDVLYIYSNSKGIILNTEIISHIKMLVGMKRENQANL